MNELLIASLTLRHVQNVGQKMARINPLHLDDSQHRSAFAVDQSTAHQTAHILSARDTGHGEGGAGSGEQATALPAGEQGNGPAEVPGL